MVLTTVGCDKRPIWMVPACSADEMDCSVGIVLISTVFSDTLPPQKLGLALSEKDVVGIHFVNSKGPVPSGCVAIVPALMAAAGMMAMLTVARPPRTDTSA